ncbi:WD repeat-containing protein 12 [Terramyces sp. JEL0728]|nr:WD repeat-containing protein 12 [Terramyces sp. JEL0728]
MSEVRKVQVSFYSRQSKYAVTDAPILVPTKLKRFGLSEIINHLLGLDDPVPFDVIINGKFLRVSLENYLNANSLSSENTLKIEFVELSLPPAESSTIIQDDWISSTKIQKSNTYLLTGSFDSYVRIWTPSGELLTSASESESPIKCADWLNDDTVVAGNLQREIYVYELDSDALSLSYTCVGHEGSIEGIANSTDNDHFATASWDKTIRIWSHLEDGIQVNAAKKSKKKQKTSFQTIKNCEKVITCMDYLSESKLIMTGHVDGSIRLWDPRSKDGLVVKMKFVSHSNWVSSLAKSETSGFHFASSSYDGTVKVWDIRSSIPLYSIGDGESRIFDLDWKNELIASGGEDSKLHIYMAKI